VRKKASLARRKQLLVAEGALLRAQTVDETCKAMAGWHLVARVVSVAVRLAGPLRRLRSGR
jgi:hypothetical protein